MNAHADPIAGVSFSDPEIQRCPFAAYDTLRNDRPVYLDPVTGHYVLTRYDDVREVMLNTRAFSNKTGLITTREGDTAQEAMRIFAEKGWLPMDTLVTNDPPGHKLYRALVDKAFTTAKTRLLHDRMAEIVNSLIDDMQDKGEVEFVREFAVELPMIVISEQLGVEPERMDDFKRWSDLTVASSSPVLTRERELECTYAIVEMQQYLAGRIAHYRANPDDSKLLSRLVHVELDGRALNMQELQDILRQLLVAGNETTTFTLTSGMKLLIEDPQLIETLHADNDKIGQFVEETLRILAPVQVLFRRAKEPVTVAGVDIPAGAIVEVRFGAANRDPAQFGAPTQVDLSRDNAQRHLSFGAGIHLCVGNQLARSELKIAFAALVNRLANFRYARTPETADFSTSYISHGLVRLWLAFDRRDPAL